MFATLINWLKRYGIKQAILECDKLEPIFAKKILEAQKALGSLPPESFAKVLVDDVQVQLCKWAKIDPKELGL